MVGSCRQSRKAKKPDLSTRLLAWYDIHRRVLPWRAAKGVRADPYRVWLSEIMLQQTTVQAVAGYYRKFLGLWPEVKALAAASQDDVLAAWAGLGYYARARNLHAAAKIVAGEMGGRFPATAAGLRELPGVGAYTAGAIAAIAYDERQAAMDANAERVIARLYAVETPMPKAKAELHALGQALVPARAGDFVQALMDLGSAICTPKRPDCGSCPWEPDCAARRLGIQETLPVKAPKIARPLKRGAAFVACDRNGAVLLVKRPGQGSARRHAGAAPGSVDGEFPIRREGPQAGAFRGGLGQAARHGPPWLHPFRTGDRSLFCRSDAAPQNAGRMGATRKAGRRGLGAVALPTVMRKIVEHGLNDDAPLLSYTSSARRR